MTTLTQVVPHNAIYWYDVEAFGNFFSCCIERDCDGGRWQFEISPWYHQGWELCQLLSQIGASGGRTGGFNNVFFDYTIIHKITEMQGNIDQYTIKALSNQIIHQGNHGNKWDNVIWERDRFVPQLDLMMINHFDNKAKLTSLKLLEFNMLMGDIIELPYEHDKHLTYEESRNVLKYNWYDVTATRDFGRKCHKAIAMRDKLTEKYGKDFTNHNDTKLGADFFVMRLGDAGIKANKRIQTPRSFVNVGEIILPYVSFERPEFNRVLEFFRQTVVPTEGEGIKDFFKVHKSDVTANINGFHVVLRRGWHPRVT